MATVSANKTKSPRDRTRGRSNIKAKRASKAGGDNRGVIFISFSGSRSKAIAEQLEGMLQKLFPSIKTFLSEKIEAGVSGWAAVQKHLYAADYGILCMTLENQLSPWMSFEAGAISKHHETSCVVPYLIDYDVTSVSSKPLGDLGFQYRRATKEDTRNLFQQIAKRVNQQRGWSKAQNRRFDSGWRRLKRCLEIQKPESRSAPTHLPKIHKMSWKIEGMKDRPFRRWLRNRVLQETDGAVSEQVENIEHQSGPNKYKGEVEHLLQPKKPEPKMTVIALCGEKGFTDPEAYRYFQLFYDFARNQAKKDRQNRVRVCRIFVERKMPGRKLGFSTQTRRVIAGHRQNAGSGVIALTISNKVRESLDEYYPGIVERLDAGFGFLLFHKPGGSVAITHEGKDMDLAYSMFKQPLNLREIIRLFIALCENSREYLAYEQDLAGLFDRIQREKIMKLSYA